MRAKATLNREYTISSVDKRVYGSFLEHMGRAVYTGIYEPGHETADENGFRTDVLDMVRDLEMPIVRYPGGNFVSAYRWEDGIGPRSERPVRLDLAWRTRETNQIGVNEFSDWARLAGTEMMLAMNLGSRGLDDARNFLEYCNHPGGTYWSDLRARHGYKEPHNVRVWCLGNEMDGPWQVGHKSAAEYGHLANEVSKAFKYFDKTLETVVCGSSNDKMKTYPEWEATVLDASYDSVDYISLHKYFGNEEQDTLNYYAKAIDLDRYIVTIGGVIDYIKAKKRSRRDVKICFDEWNVWYHDRKEDGERITSWDWPEAPPLLEELYNLEDAIFVGSLLNVFMRRSDRIKIACMAQLVNVIAPILTKAGGPAWRQSIYYPLQYASKYGRGTALAVAQAGPTYDCDVAQDVPYLDLSAVLSDDGRSIAVFAINRSLDEPLGVTIDLQGFKGAKIVEHRMLAGDDLKARNSVEDQNRIVPKAGRELAVDDAGALVGSLPPKSYHFVLLSVASA
ncbi:alpha-N-arabinofuranosidase [Sinorhizobium saheli]|uniref:non-reducing end alpha-L-arabinofuranosidase n=1 Tax=Sinorhizobium saheli TaxID=36856 RepID=A0A178YIM7_SINSA|nr:alpha-N-arabinofuranosidase [Sinorhizobium saheli]MQW89485.1 alpha-N-arabinofuranosidase [Sinorhizobium saheli]OAP47339.1 alpha-N-arabinofuranosidase [Sinorhizobium saheli]